MMPMLLDFPVDALACKTSYNLLSLAGGTKRWAVHVVVHPYGTSYTSGKDVRGPDARAQAVARYQGQRFARYAKVVAAAREADEFRVRRPRPEQFHAAALGSDSRN